MNLTTGAISTITETKALWLEKPGVATLRDQRLSQPRGDEVLLRSSFGAISRGTENLVFKGQVPKSEWDNMRCLHQEGGFEYPVKYGYCLVGEIEAGPHDLVGTRGFCLHPHQARALLSVNDVHPIPQNVPSRRAVLAANMETALNICWDAGISPGTKLCIFGAGVVGLLLAWLAARVPGVEVTLVDVNEDRREIAESFGVRFSPPQDLQDAFDTLVNLSASGEALQQAIDHAAFEGKIVEASWHGDKPVALRLGGAFHSKRLAIVSSQVGHVAPLQRGRIDTKKRMHIALSLLADPVLDMLFTGETPFSALAETYGDILADPSTLCHRIIY